MNHRRPEPLEEVRDRAHLALVLFLAHPDPDRAPTRELEALTRGRTLLRRLAALRGLSPRMVLARAEAIRLERGPVALALALNAVEETGDPSQLLADPATHVARWRRGLEDLRR